MKDIIKDMDKAFDSRIRLAIISILRAKDWVDFNTLKAKLGVTDGNLASHTATLERKEYIIVRKQFIAKRPNTSYKMTDKGEVMFNLYIKSINKLLSLTKEDIERPEPKKEKEIVPIVVITNTIDTASSTE